MTKEELKQEARRLYIDWERRYCKESIPDLLVMFAEPREKRIAELEQIINDMQNAECTSCTTLGGMQIKIAELTEQNTSLLTSVENLNKTVQELEHENARLKEINTHTLSQLNLDNGELILEIDKLQKENAELKEQLGDKVMQKLKDKADLVWKLKTANEQKADQLTKAKGIIEDQKELLDRVLSGAETLSEFAQNTLRKAEQFLKDSEVEK